MTMPERERLRKVVMPARNREFLTLEEAHIMLDIIVSDPATDAQLALQIALSSAEIERRANRWFAREEVCDTWRGLPTRRMFLSTYPVREHDVFNVRADGSYSNGWQLDEEAGMLVLDSAPSEVQVYYIGGFDCPSSAPFPLKRLCGLMVSRARQQTKIQQSPAVASGVRSISHKDKRVMFFEPSQSVNAVSTSQGGGSSGSMGSMEQAIENLLDYYRRVEV